MKHPKILPPSESDMELEQLLLEEDLIEACLAPGSKHNPPQLALTVYDGTVTAYEWLSSCMGYLNHAQIAQQVFFTRPGPNWRIRISACQAGSQDPVTIMTVRSDGTVSPYCPRTTGVTKPPATYGSFAEATNSWLSILKVPFHVVLADDGWWLKSNYTDEAAHFHCCMMQAKGLPHATRDFIRLYPQYAEGS